MTVIGSKLQSTWLRKVVYALAQMSTPGVQNERNVNLPNYIHLMLYCEYCATGFFDGEVITIRNLNGTELMYHHGCWISFSDEQRKVAAAFGHDFDFEDGAAIQFYSRVFQDRQITSES